MSYAIQKTTSKVRGCFILVLFAVSGCEQTESFEGLEEGAFLQQQVMNSGLPVLIGVSSGETFAGSEFRLDANNSATGDDKGMTYQCSFAKAGQGGHKPCTELPGFMLASFDSKTGVLQWWPSDEEIGQYSIGISGSNSRGTDSRQAKIHVVKDNRPSLLALDAQIVERGSQLLLDFDDVRVNGDTDMSYECAFDTAQDGVVAADANNCQKLPGQPAIKFDSQSGILAWVPGVDAAEAYEIRITGTNRYGKGEIVFAVTVIEPRGELVRLTSVRDYFVNSPQTLMIDIDNTITEDDSGVTYTCTYDTVIDGRVLAGSPCAGIPGTVASTFDERKGMFIWQPNVDTAESIEIRVRGEKSGAVDEETFAILFGDGSFGEIGNSALSFSPASVDFGNVQIGSESAVTQVTITNIASVDVFLQIPLVGNAAFQATYSTCPVSPTKLAPTATCIIGVKFRPTVPAHLGTIVTMNFGSSTGDTSAYSSSFALSGVGAGQLDFDGLREITNVTHNSLKLQWDPTADAITYIVFKVNSGGALEFVETVMNIGGTVSERSYDGLSPGTSYTYRVRATDVFGVHDGNNVDVTVSTLPNTAPNLTSPAAPSAYAGWLVPTVNYNNASTANDYDADGDSVFYTCRYDNTVDGTVINAASLCTTIVNQDGTNITFNLFSGEMANWIPRFADEGTSFEFRIIGSDPYGGSSTRIFSVTVQDGDPEITALSDRLLPNDALTAGSNLAIDINNVRFSPAKDQFMTYTCTFQRYETSGLGAAANCSTLPGTASFSGATGVFSWTPSAAAFGAYRLEFTGTNASGSDIQSIDISVASDYHKSDLVLDLQAGFANGVQPGFNGGSYLDQWTSLATGNFVGDLLNFSTTSWTGVGSAAAPYALQFDGNNDAVEFSEGLASYDDMLVETWVKLDDISRNQVVFSNGDAIGRGITLGTKRISTGSGFSNYSTEVLSDSPKIYWRFHDVSGTNVPDSSVDANDVIGLITVAGATGVQSPGALVDFTDQSFYTASTGRIGVSPNYTLAAEWSIELWFRYPFPTNCANATEGCTFVRASTNDRPIYVNNALKLGAFRNGVGFSDSNFLMSTLSAGWHHMVAVGDGSTTKYYIDGVEVGSIAWDGAANINTVGNRNGDSGSIGSFDEFAVYEQALTPARIAAHYAAGMEHDYCDFLLPPNMWHQLGARVDSTGSTLEAYVNGASVCSVALTNTPGVVNTSGGVQLGRGAANVASSLDGALAEVRAYDGGGASVLTDNFSTKLDRFTPTLGVPAAGLKLLLIAGEGMFQDTGATTAATADGHPVSRWRDLTGLGGDVTPVALSPVLRPTAVNGRAAVEFDGATGASSQRLRNTVNYSIGPSTVFSVARVVSSTPAPSRTVAGFSNNWLLGHHSAGRNKFHALAWVHNPATPVIDGQWDIFMGDLDASSNARLFTNGQLMGSATNAAFRGPNGISLGAYGDGSQASYSQVAAVIIYDRVLTVTERQQVFNYLNTLYDIY